jgi:hypothetical protein
VRRIPVLFGVAVLAAACSSGPRLSHAFRADGVSVRYPKGWDATSRPLTPVTDPAQVLAVASYRLPRDNGGAAGCMPKQALDRLGPSGAFIFGWEVTGRPEAVPGSFPLRPKHFALTRLEDFECLGRSYALRFRQAGRYFHIHVALGRDASSGTRKTVLRILDSFSARAGR